jgi:PTS system mannose-specific IIA component
MIGAVIVTHGTLCKELLETVKRIVGKVSHMECVGIDWDEDVEAGKKRINNAIKRQNTGSGVIIFTDMFGGTPSNISFSFLEKGNIEVITGVNLPMLLKFTFVQRSTDINSVAESVCKEGKSAIYLASSIYNKNK